MWWGRKKHSALLIVSGLALLITSCSPSTRYKVLNVFFDGVPPQEEKTLTIGLDTLGQADSVRSLAMAATRNIPQYDYHQPYQQKECGSCHDENRMGRLVAEEPELCYQCHDSNLEKHSFKHGPAGAGFCTSCHRPHMSEADNLLLADGNNLCFVCHNTELLAESAIHQNVKKKDDCTQCHSPHSSENMFMLEKGACYNCHEEKINDYSFLHGPVSANFCSTCHETHASEKAGLLKLPGQDLCLNCHSQTLIFNNPAHQDENKNNCTQCHNPHGGEDEFMLN